MLARISIFILCILLLSGKGFAQEQEQNKGSEEESKQITKTPKDTDLSFPYKPLSAKHYWGLRTRIIGGTKRGWAFTPDNEDVPYNSSGQGFWVGFDVLIDITEKNSKIGYPIYSVGLEAAYSQTPSSSGNPEESTDDLYRLGFLGLKGAAGWRFPLQTNSTPSALQLQGAATIAGCIGYDQFQQFNNFKLSKNHKSLNLFPCAKVGLEATIYFLQRLSLGLDTSFLYYASPVQLGKTGNFQNFFILSTVNLGWVF